MADTFHISYNTFMPYKNIIYNYIVSYIGKRKLHSIKRNDLIRFFDMLNSPVLLRMGYAVIGSSFQFAKSNNLINSNVAITAIKAKRGEVKKGKRNSGINNTPKKRPVLNTDQMYNLLWTCEADEHDLFKPLLFTIATGCRISELIALQSVNPMVRLMAGVTMINPLRD
jgi:integrase